MKVVGPDSRRSADGIGEVASSAALDTAFAVYADGQLPPGHFRPVWASFRYRGFTASGAVSEHAVKRPEQSLRAKPPVNTARPVRSYPPHNRRIQLPDDDDPGIVG
jgi:hypothetical protein